MSTDSAPAERRRKGRRRILVVLAILLLLAAGVVAAVMLLNSDNTPVTSSEPSADRSAVMDVSVSPGTAEGFAGARADVEDFDCELSQGRWSVAGSVTNPLQESVSYRIYSAFRDSDLRTVGLLQVDVEDVEAGATREWSGSIDVSTPNLTCVLRVERTTSGS